MLTALTGTPGVGKSAVGKLLQERGLQLVYMDELARASDALREFDLKRQSREVDLGVLGAAVPSKRPLILVGHLSHLLKVDKTIVLRCHPETLRKRLKSRGWNAAKVQENVEAEAIGVITGEALSQGKAYEVDTSEATPGETSTVVMEILEGRGERFLAPWVDWSEVILGWF